MAKRTGLGANLYAAGYNISGDVAAVDELAGGAELLEMTGIDKYAYERQAGIRDGSGSWTVFFNPGAGATVATHDLLAALPTTDVHLMYCTGTTIGDAAACMVAKQSNYAASRGDDGALTFEVEAVANGFGLEWGQLLTAGVRADTTATNGSSLDFGATIGTTAFGLQAYLQVFSFTGTSCTIKLQESSDNGGADTWADVTGGSFGAQTALGASRLETGRTQSVERYLRVATTGTFTQCSFAVTVVKNLTTVLF